MIIKINNLIIKVKLLKAQIINEYLLKENEKILKSSFNSENDESDNKKSLYLIRKKIIS